MDNQNHDVHLGSDSVPAGEDATATASHSGDFAKIIRVESGGIVLFYKDNDDDGSPILRQITSMDGITGALNLEFGDGDEAWDKRDAAFAAADIERANSIREVFKQFIAGSDE